IARAFAQLVERLLFGLPGGIEILLAERALCLPHILSRLPKTLRRVFHAVQRFLKIVSSLPSCCARPFAPPSLGSALPCCWRNVLSSNWRCRPIRSPRLR